MSDPEERSNEDIQTDSTRTNSQKDSSLHYRTPPIQSTENRKTVTPVNIYHDIVQKAALAKGRAAGLGLPKKERLSRLNTNVAIPTDGLVDEFGKPMIRLDVDIGKYVDSFGNPLLRGADDEQVACFRENRDLSKHTRALIDTHRRNKEREEIMKGAPKPPPKIDVKPEPKNNKEDDGQMPSFLR